VLPKEPTGEELAFDWTLSEADKARILQHRGDDNRRRYAVQLCVLRKYGRFLDDYKGVPTKVIGYLSRQLGIGPVIDLSPASRKATEAKYRNDIRDYLGYAQFNKKRRQELQDWILAAVFESFYVEKLIEKSERFLKGKKIVLPPAGHLERIINSAYSKAERTIFETLSSQLSNHTKRAIDKLLQTDPESGTTPFFKSNEYPPEAKARKIARYFQHYENLMEVGIFNDIFLNHHPDLIKKLAWAVKSYDAWRIRRFEDTKRYALCACFLHETLQNVVDNLIELNARFLTDMQRETRNIYEHAHRKLRKRLRRGIPILEAFAKTALSIENDQPVDKLYHNNDRVQIQSAVEDSVAFRRLEERGYVEILHGKYPNFKRYFPLILRLDFRAEKGANYLIEAITIARRYNDGILKRLPSASPCRFVPKRWKKMLYTQDGRINPRTWEIALDIAISEAVRSGDLYLPAGRNYVSFWNLVYNDQKWAAEKTRESNKQGYSLDPDPILKNLTNEFDQTVTSALKRFDQNAFIKVKAGQIRFGRDKAEKEAPEVKKLRQLIEAAMPKIRIEHLLMQVDALCGFSGELKPLYGSLGRSAERHPTLMATIVAHGTNLGVFTMADSTSNITVDVLRDLSKICLRHETLKAANTQMVNYHQSLEASSVYGSGKVSSSDGQRFGVLRSSLITSMYPRYFGYYDNVVTIYTHISDLMSVFGTLVISCGQKEALYVLNGLLENDSDISSVQHHTDTGGYADHIFALCFMLGISFMPRISNLHKKRFFKIDRNRHYGALEPLFKGTINFELIREQWESLVRVAASLKNRIVAADVIVKRLVNSSPADRLSKALVELGRLVKTIYLLNYMQDETIRRQVHKQLNRGEHRQNVARHVFFADQGEFKTADLAQIMNKASCLSLLSNAILVWNTVHISKIVKHLRKIGHKISDAHLAKVSPLMFKHIIVNGTYDFSPSRRLSAVTK
jgi:TnpA family transposase